MKSLPLILALSTFGSTAVAHGIDNKEVTSVRHIASRSIETRELGTFTAIKLDGIADLFLAQGPNQQVQVDADEGMTSRVETTVENGTLVIKTKGNFHSPISIKVYVTIPQIESIASTGTGDVIGLTPVHSNDLKLSTSGTGTITLDVSASALASTIVGTGNINLSGTVKASKVSVEGTGDYHGRKLVSDDVAVSSTGTGDAEVTPKHLLRVNLTGTGDVRYAADVEKVESSITGSGSLRKLPKSSKG